MKLNDIVLEEEKAWVKIAGYDHYYINEDGEVKTVSPKYPKGYIVKLSLNSDGYQNVNLTKDGVSHSEKVHILMGRTFLDHEYVKKGLIVDHKDNDRSNNKLTNLRLITQKENIKRMYDQGRR